MRNSVQIQMIWVLQHPRQSDRERQVTLEVQTQVSAGEENFSLFSYVLCLGLQNKLFTDKSTGEKACECIQCQKGLSGMRGRHREKRNTILSKEDQVKEKQ